MSRRGILSVPWWALMENTELHTNGFVFKRDNWFLHDFRESTPMMPGRKLLQGFRTSSQRQLCLGVTGVNKWKPPIFPGLS